MLEELFEHFIQEKFKGIVEIYDYRLQATNEGFHLEIELDDLRDPRGSVTIQMCSDFSRVFQSFFDEVIASGKEWCGALPKELTSQNYSLEVSSAGADRCLKLPQDLNRFKKLPIELKYRKEVDEQAGDNICEDVFVFIGDSKEFVFQKYKKKQKKKKGPNKNDFEKKHYISLERIVEARLYLDF